MELYMNPQDHKVYTKKEWYALYILMGNQEGFTWKDGIERPCSGIPLSMQVIEYQYRCMWQGIEIIFTFLKITK